MIWKEKGKISYKLMAKSATFVNKGNTMPINLNHAPWKVSFYASSHLEENNEHFFIKLKILVAW